VELFIKGLATVAVVAAVYLLVIAMSLMEQARDTPIMSKAEHKEASTLCWNNGGVLHLRVGLADGSYTKSVNCKNGEEFQLNNIQEK
jgi:hypothetical protein